MLTYRMTATIVVLNILLLIFSINIILFYNIFMNLILLNIAHLIADGYKHKLTKWKNTNIALCE